MASGLPARLRNPWLRRAVTVPTVAGSAAGLAASSMVWGPLSAGIDLARGRRDVPSLRILGFALGWTTLETVGVGASAALWGSGRHDDEAALYGLQRWWADRLIGLLEQTAGLAFEVEGMAELASGPVVLCARHVSVADALVPMWLLGQADMRPRYVMKDDLQLDPCLDVVGNLLPNHFVDRDPSSSQEGLDQLEELARGMGDRDAAIVFPEGAVITEANRAKAIERVASRNPARVEATRGLQILGPVRPGGTAALLRGSPDADLVFVNHRGMESLQRLVDAPSQVPFDRPVEVRVQRVPRAEVPDGDEFVPWLDARWAELDRDLVSWR